MLLSIYVLLAGLLDGPAPPAHYCRYHRLDDDGFAGIFFDDAPLFFRSFVRDCNARICETARSPNVAVAFPAAGFDAPLTPSWNSPKSASRSWTPCFDSDTFRFTSSGCSSVTLPLCCGKREREREKRDEREEEGVG